MSPRPSSAPSRRPRWNATSSTSSAEDPSSRCPVRTAPATAYQAVPCCPPVHAALIASPECAHGMPGVLTNALEWMAGSGELSGRPVAVPASPPWPGGDKARAWLGRDARCDGCRRPRGGGARHRPGEVPFRRGRFAHRPGHRARPTECLVRAGEGTAAARRGVGPYGA
ncbi:NAD(P)H-dependent oxidoreductase [Streptomyces sp. NPDC127037]|uniref:NAD(P)H-dependent oxidoreductase n=1 Tax=Streptomyces sp. NPDC127037 TaxID=3347113 RepID=UPI0036612D79